MFHDVANLTDNEWMNRHSCHLFHSYEDFAEKEETAPRPETMTLSAVFCWSTKPLDVPHKPGKDENKTPW